MNKAFPAVPLCEVLRQIPANVEVDRSATYQFAGVYSFGRGVFRSVRRIGSEFAYSKLTRVQCGDFVYPKLMAWEGAFGVVPQTCDGCYVSPEFPVFRPLTGKILSCYLDYYFRIPRVWDEVSSGSIGTNVRRRRLHPVDFLNAKIPLPPLSAQRRIVARINVLVSQINEARTLRQQAIEEAVAMLSAEHRRIRVNAPRKPLAEIAPLTRRPVCVDVDEKYPQIAVRSFGRGTFHKPPLVGSEVTWEKPFLVRKGDILVSNIKAWEGALAVAGPEDDGRVGSHRYLTCVPVSGVATSRFVCAFLLSPEGLYEIGEASPGSADRNRTLSSKRFMRIPVPVPKYNDQVRFDRLCEAADALKRLQSETTVELEALLPSILDKAFKGEL